MHARGACACLCLGLESLGGHHMHTAAPGLANRNRLPTLHMPTLRSRQAEAPTSGSRTGTPGPPGGSNLGASLCADRDM